MNHANTFVRILSDQRDAPSTSESITRSTMSEDLFSVVSAKSKGEAVEWDSEM